MPYGPIDIQLTSAPGGVIVAVVRGDFDAVACETVTEALGPHLTAAVRVDLGDVSFMDSAALHCLSELRRQAAAAGGGLVVTAMSRPVQRVIELSGLGHGLLAAPEHD